MDQYTFSNHIQAHNISRTGFVVIPDQVAVDQHAYDGKTFPILKLRPGRPPEKGRGRLMGDEYDLWGPGTGDPVVRIER